MHSFKSFGLFFETVFTYWLQHSLIFVCHSSFFYPIAIAEGIAFVPFIIVIIFSPNTSRIFNIKVLLSPSYPIHFSHHGCYNRLTIIRIWSKGPNSSGYKLIFESGFLTEYTCWSLSYWFNSHYLASHNTQ